MSQVVKSVYSGHMHVLKHLHTCTSILFSYKYILCSFENFLQILYTFLVEYWLYNFHLLIDFKNLSDPVSLSGYWNYSLFISKNLTQKSGQEKVVNWQMAAWLVLWLLLVCVRRNAVSLSVSNFASRNNRKDTSQKVKKILLNFSRLK